MKGGAASREMRPLRERFKVIYRLARLDLDDDLQLVATVGRHQEQIGIQGGRSGADAGVLFIARIHDRFVLAAKLGVEQSDYPVVLELLTNGPNQDRAQRAPPNGWISTEIEIPKFSMEMSSSTVIRSGIC